MTTVLLTISALFAIYTTVLYFSQERLLFLPHIPGREVDFTPADIGLGYESLKLNTQDGMELDGWFIPASQTGPTLLFFHGNAGNISHRLDSIRIFHDLDLDVLIFDYRGYGRSTGKPSEQGVYRDAETAWRYLTEARKINPDRIILFGRSLGSAVAAWLATRTQAGAVILESPFTSVPDMAAKLYPLAPVRLLARLEFNTLAAVKSIQAPLLVMHSRQDEIIPFSQGRAVYEAAGSRKRFVELRGGHNDGFIVSGGAYVNSLRSFLADSVSATDTGSED